MRYKVHIQNKGWTDWVEEGRRAGTSGESLRLEAIIIEGVDSYRAHIQDKDWSGWVKAGEVAGTVGEGKRIEAIEINGKDVNYRVHAENFGWLDWARNGEMAGTTSGGLRVEAIQLIESAEPLSVDDARAGVNIEPKPIPPVEPAKPAGNLSGKIICINPGHGGSDPGACGDLRESDMNLTVAMRLGQLLTERGGNVVYTRTTDVRVPLSDRPAIANVSGADLFISIHHNGANDPNASGTCAICYPGSENGYRLATLCLNGLYNRLGLQQRGLIQRDDSDVTYSDMPAVITEASFASSPADCALFNNGGAELEALGILDGVLAYFG
ncbi:MAG: N-acetylmuramoyl-L-alanine amidase [Acetobacterium sp.]|uniref:N-acetylmuramoyl-L-alanine amidase n=1 Tax=Acetobacterium sp. TaxID=1872094 RepID=UPI003241FFA7